MSFLGDFSLWLLGLFLLLSVLAWNAFLTLRFSYQKKQLEKQNQAKEKRHEAQFSVTESLKDEIVFGDAGRLPATEREEDDLTHVDLDIQEVLDIHFVAPVLGESLISQLNLLLKDFPEGLSVFALTHDDFHRDHLEPNEYYQSVHVALVLATRHGIVSQEDWARLYGTLEHVSLICSSDSFVGAEYGDFEAKMRRLYQQIKSVDLVFNCSLKLQSSKSISDIVKTLINNGFHRFGDYMVYQKNGVRYQYKVSADGSLFEDMSRTVTDLSVLFDIPNSTYSKHGFSDFYDVLYQLSKSLNATMLTVNGEVISERMLRLADDRLLEVYKNMRDIQVEPGSAKAALLFTDV